MEASVLSSAVCLDKAATGISVIIQKKTLSGSAEELNFCLLAYWTTVLCKANFLEYQEQNLLKVLPWVLVGFLFILNWSLIKLQLGQLNCELASKDSLDFQEKLHFN